MQPRNLFDSRGRFIAVLDAETLFAPSGRPLGMFISYFQIFVDNEGHYIGDLVQGNRLMRSQNSPHRGTRFDARRDARARLTVPGKLVQHYPIPPLPSFEDVELEQGATVAA